MDELGVIGYGRYWLLLEFLSDEFDGESVAFEVHSRKLSTQLQIRLNSNLTKFMEVLNQVELVFNLVKDGKSYSFKAPILLELMGRDFKRARNERAASAPKIKNKNKIKNNINKKAKAITFDFEKVYENYPRKSGKALGIERCKAQVKTIEDYNDLSNAVEAYKNAVLGRETRFIKQFSSFIGANGLEPWRDALEENFENTKDVAKDDFTIEDLGA